MFECAKSFCRILIIVVVTGTCGLTGCRSGNKPLFNKISSSVSGIDFINQLKYSDTLSVLDFEYMFNGSGVGLIDVNNDGLLDIFFGGNMVSSALYLNKGNLHFENITKKAGVETDGWIYGISIVDINNDGYSDIYICKAGNRKTPASSMRNIFFINNRNGTFTDHAAAMGLDDDGYDIHASFLDYDKDGDLDVYLLRNAFVNYNRNTARNKIEDGGAPSTDRLFRNNGNMTFTDVSKDAGIAIEGFGLGATVCDLNNDNWPDVYVSNDFLTNDLVWINNCDGTFSNKAREYLRHQSYNGMGNDVADYNNDGLEDIMVVDMLPPDNERWKLTMRGNTYEEFQNALSYGYEPQYVRNTLQLNNGNGSFSEIGQLAGVHATEWSWAPLFADFDNDGYKDLFISNGYRQDITNLDFIRYGKNALFVGTPEANRKERLDQLKKFPGIKIHSYLYKNNRDLTFKDVSGEWGMTDPSYSNGAAYGDLDNDGDLDIVINKLDEVSAVYENKSSKSHWLRFGFKGSPTNMHGVGTRVNIWQKGNMQTNFFTPYRGYLSSSEPYLHFGLADSNIDSINIIWPDGKEQTLKNVKSDQFITVDHKNAAQTNKTKSAPPSTLFKTFEGIKLLHEEDKYVDFKNQPLLPKLYSHEGPGMAVADINGDGTDDVFVSASAEHKPVLMLQQKDGTFLKKEFDSANTADNMGAIFFDADGDGDQDLYVAAGGAAQKNNKNIFRHHFYSNDGAGNFLDVKSAIPEINSSSASVTASDFDHDGDLDLFVAGRVSPGEYPMTPRSYLLRNDSKPGQCLFIDVSKKCGDDLSSPGMVTVGLWTDFDNDNWQDLIIAGEFMPLRFYKNTNGKLKEITETTGLIHTNGWWNSLVAGDFDKDGDMDYVAGNLGLNSPYRASALQPLCVYAADYDKDGRIDPIMCHFVEGEEYIAHARDDINRQMLPMRARFRTYQSYAEVSFKDAFRKDEIGQATVFKAENFQSSYIENVGNGKFRMSALPLVAQFAPINGMVCSDFNGDGNPDLLCTGNSFATEVQTGRYDALGSLLFTGNGKGNFKPHKNELDLHGDHKSIVLVENKGQTLAIIGTNSDSLKAVSITAKQRSVMAQQDEIGAVITNEDGSKYRQELAFGQSYLSQTVHKLFVPVNTKSVELYTITGKKRTINF